MDIRSVGNQVAGQTTLKAVTPKYTPREAVISDGFKKSDKSESLDADKMKSLQTDQGKEAWGVREAKGLLGMGVMFGGMMAAAIAGGPFTPALMLGAFFGGMAIMAL